MITLQKFLEAIEFKITEGSNYGWNCYGPNARYLDCYKEDHYSISALFDSKDQFVYAIELWDYINNREYRWQHPDYKEAFLAEAKERGIDSKESLDNSKFIDLDVTGDILEKIRCVVAGKEYDTRVQIEVDFADEDLLQYMKLAHTLDITFNELVERAISEAIKEHELDPEAYKEKAKRFVDENYTSV